jgi:hypothetical protein
MGWDKRPSKTGYEQNRLSKQNRLLLGRPSFLRPLEELGKIIIIIILIIINNNNK